MERLNLLGVSIYSNDELEAAIEGSELDVIQLPFNVLDRSARKIELLKKARRRNKKVYARSAFLQGLFFMDPMGLPVKLLPLSEQLLRIQRLASENGIIFISFARTMCCIKNILIGF